MVPERVEGTIRFPSLYRLTRHGSYQLNLQCGENARAFRSRFAPKALWTDSGVFMPTMSEGRKATEMALKIRAEAEIHNVDFESLLVGARAAAFADRMRVAGRGRSAQDYVVYKLTRVIINVNDLQKNWFSELERIYGNG